MITLQDVFDAGWDAFVANDNPPSTILGTTACCYQSQRIDGKIARCVIGEVLYRKHPEALAAILARGRVRAGIKYLIGERFFEQCQLVNPFASIPAEGLGKAQADLHDSMVLRSLSVDGVWLPPYNTQEKRKRVYIEFARQYGLVVPNV